MKKRIVGLILILSILLCALVMLTACNSDEGIYFEVSSEGALNENSWIELFDDGTWTDNDGLNGTYQITDGVIDFYSGDIKILSGILKDGVLNLEIGVTYKKEGATGDGEDPASDGKYTVTFNTVGGSAIASAKVDKDGKLTAPTNPTKVGHTFAGWYKDALYTSIWDFAVDTVTGNTVLYARWTSEDGKIVAVENATINDTKITIVVDKNVEYVDLSSSVTIGGNGTWKLYYDMMGQTEISTKIAVGQNGQLHSGDNIFYIVATATDGQQSRTYELTVHRKYDVVVSLYDGDTMIGSKNCTTYTTLPSFDDLAPAGYSITGYSLADGTSFDVTTETVSKGTKLYISKAPAKYTITLDVNGGDALTATTKEVTHNQYYTLPVPTRTGYDFLGWSTSNYNNSGSFVTDADGSSTAAYTLGTNTTLYAKWSVKYYQINVVKEPSNAGFVEGSGDTAYGSNKTLTAHPYDGYTFLGWFDGDTKISEDGKYTYRVENMPANTVTYTAKYMECPVTLTANISAGGEFIGVEKTVVGGQATITATLNAGYLWDGWYQNGTKVSEGTDMTYTFTMSTNAVTYEARFVECTSHTLNADCVCTLCDKTVHSINDDCTCTNCGDVLHGTKDGQYCRHDNIVYFGSYPQSKVTSSSLKSALGSYNSTWTAFDEYYYNGEEVTYMYYKDKEYNGEMYRGIYFTQYRQAYIVNGYIGGSEDNGSSQDESGYYTNTTYWFKYEPIKWRIITTDYNGSGKAMLLADIVLDGQHYDYNSDGTYSNNYAESSIRAWLNDNFYNTAFSELEKEIIATTLVDNSAATTSNAINNYACENTNDKVFLPSWSEIDSLASASDVRRTATDYAQMQGVSLVKDTISESSNNMTSWLLRSSHPRSASAVSGALYNGMLSTGLEIPVYCSEGIVPAITITL